MKKLATFTTMAFLLATAGAFAQAPSTTTASGDKAATKTTRTAKSAKTHKGHRKVGTKPGTPAPTPAQK
jgi:hypothetical protein